MKYCSKCGKEILDEAVICPHCGCAAENRAPNRDKEKQNQYSVLSLVFSLLSIIFPLFAIVGFIFGFIALRSGSPNEENKYATVGFHLSIIIFAIWAGLLTYYFLS